MFNFIKKLFGLSGSTTSSSNAQPEDRPPHFRTRTASDRYFRLLQDLQGAKSERDWEKAADIAKELIEVMPEFVRESQEGYGGLPPNLPLFADGARSFAIIGDEEALQQLLNLTKNVPELTEWQPTVEDALIDRDLVTKIRRLLTERPGTLQTSVKEAISAHDGRKVATLLRQLEEGGEIQRIRYKRTYVLGLTGADVPLPEDHPAHPQQSKQGRPAAQHIATTSNTDHQQRTKLKPREIRLANLDYIPLPRAPLKWEERHKESGGRTEAEDMFETSWKIGSVEKLSMEDRPDTAYRKLGPHAAGSFLIDDLGKAEQFPQAPAALVSVGKAGDILREAPLNWSLYRWQVNPLGTGIIAMDKDGVVHAYDQHINKLFTTPLIDAPEMPGLMSRYSFHEGNLKNHARTVALSPTGDRYLFTVVDCAYILGLDGSSQWALQLPKQEGWERVAEVSSHAGTSRQIDQAMSVLEVQPPVSLKDVRKSYRRLAQKWHPDKNQGSKQAEERFKEIANAAELLSGLDLSSLASDVEQGVYQRTEGTETLEVEGLHFTIKASMQASEKQASDWIYAASFAHDGGAFLAGYSGRVLRTDNYGTPIRAYDIGAVPRRIADTGDYLYFLTDTRLYILRDHGLVNLLDVFDEGALVIGQTGFGLLEKKRFRWFTKEGKPVGTVLTNNPIRRVYSTPNGLLVETRQRRAEITGAPEWWAG